MSQQLFCAVVGASLRLPRIVGRRAAVRGVVSSVLKLQEAAKGFDILVGEINASLGITITLVNGLAGQFSCYVYNVLAAHRARFLTAIDKSSQERRPQEQVLVCC